MTTAIQPAGGGGAAGRPSASSLADVIDTILDKGLVIDAFVRVSLVGIELITVDVRIVVASVDTYLRFAKAVNRLDIAQDKQGLPQLVGGMTEGTSKRKVKGAASGVLESAGELLREYASGREQEGEPTRSRRRYREEEE
jgi:hypothetical protein